MTADTSARDEALGPLGPVLDEDSSADELDEDSSADELDETSSELEEEEG